MLPVVEVKKDTPVHAVCLSLKKKDKIGDNFSGTIIVYGSGEIMDHSPEEAMKIQYRLSRLSAGERAFHEMILMEEMDNQHWFFILCAADTGKELIISLQ